MIVLVLRGGLGNQMYEFAAAKALAIRANTEVVLNTKLGFVTDKQYFRRYCLDCFNIRYINSSLLSFDVFGGRIIEKISKRIGHHLFFPKYKYIEDKKIDIKDLISNPDNYKNVILAGTWNRNDDVFIDVMNEILDEFTIRWDFPSIIKKYQEKILSEKVPVVAMGVRMFQEIKKEQERPESQRPMEPSYYKKAMDYYRSKYGNVKFYIFTEVPEWVKQNISSIDYNYEFVSTGGDDRTSVFDMYLFSLFDSYILSPSTFYGWGVKMNRRKNIEVVIPYAWVQYKEKSWIQM